MRVRERLSVQPLPDAARGEGIGQGAVRLAAPGVAGCHGGGSEAEPAVIAVVVVPVPDPQGVGLHRADGFLDGQLAPRAGRKPRSNGAL